MESKQRHGCVTAWLTLMIIANSISSLAYLFMGKKIAAHFPTPVSQSVIMALAVIGIANLVFSIMLFKWKKWAFWAFAGTSLITLVINISIEIGIASSILGLAGVGILFAVLQIKKDKVSSWENLE